MTLLLKLLTNFATWEAHLPQGDSGFERQKNLAGQSLKTIFTLRKYLDNFTPLKPSHVVALFETLISPISNYGSEVWGLYKAKAIETVHLQFCKRLLGVNQTTQNDFIYRELGRIDYQTRTRYLCIIKWCLKIVTIEENKYIKHVYKVLLTDNDTQPLKPNRSSSVKNLLRRAGCMDAWLFQGVGSIELFLNIFKVRLRDMFMQDGVRV